MAHKRETSRHGVELVDIASPYTGTDRVLRRVDSLARLRGSGIIGDREMRAAEKYRIAFETVKSSGISSLSLYGMSAAAPPGSRTPPLRVLLAAETLAQARRHLGSTDYHVLMQIVAYGRSINEVAEIVFGGKRNREHVGHRLRWGLRSLADMYFGMEKQRLKHFYRALDAALKAGDSDEVIPAKVAHVSRKGISY